MSAFTTGSAQVTSLTIVTNLAQIQLVPDQRGVLLAAWSLANGQRLRINYLGLHFIKFATYGTTVRRSELPLLYAGLYYRPPGQLDEVGGRPLLWIGLNGPGYQRALTDIWQFTQPGSYCLRLVNNASVAEIQAAVTGAGILEAA